MENQRDPEDIILEWCGAEDFHSGGMVYDRRRPPDVEQSSESEEDPTEQSPQLGTGKKKRAEPPPIEIDPMDPATLGSGKIKLAWQNLSLNGYQTPSETLEPLLRPQAFYDRCVMIGPKPKPVPRRDTRLPRKNVADLQKWGLLVTAAVSLIICFAVLFTVPKPTGLHRVIIDGRPGNGQLARPPYFRFFQPIELVAALRSLGKFTAFSRDIRHFFYRLTLPSYIGVFYGLLLISGLFIAFYPDLATNFDQVILNAFAF